MTRSLVTRLAVLSLIPAVLLSVAGVAVLRRSAHNEVLAQAEARNARAAAIAAAAVDDHLRSVVDQLAMMASHGPFSGRDAHLRAFLRAAVDIDEVVVYRADGSVESAAASRYLADPARLDPAPELTRLLDGRAYDVTILDGPWPRLRVSVPAYDPPGVRAGVLAGTLDVDRVARPVERVHFGATGTAQLLGPDGRILVHRSRNLVVSGSSMVLADNPDASHPRVLRDDKRLLAAAETQLFPGTVVVEQTVEDALATVAEAVHRLTVLLVLVVLAAVGAATVVAVRLLRPLRSLASASRRLLHGDTPDDLPTDRRDEVGDLARDFAHMAGVLDERLAALQASNTQLDEARREVEQQLADVVAANARAAASDQRFRAGFESASVGMAVVGPDRRFDDVNPVLCEMLGRTKAELQELTCGEILHEDDRGHPRGFYEEAMAGRADTFRGEVRLLRPDGSVVWALLSSSVVRPESGTPYFFSQLQDVSARKRSEQALRRAYEREVEAARHLQRVDEMKDAFLGAVSHDLRTPLAAIVGFADTLTRSDVDIPEPMRQDLTRRLAGNARRLERLLSDLLDLDRLSRGVIEPRRRPTDVAAVAQSVIDSLDTKDHRTFVVTDGSIATIDPAHTERIIENLVANAIRHTPPATNITVRLFDTPDGLRIDVEDDGPGIRDDEKDAVFEPFRHGVTSARHSPGAGIGLSLVARFASLHGGRAWVRDRPGGGACFSVLLPEGEGDTRELVPAETG